MENRGKNRARQIRAFGPWLGALVIGLGISWWLLQQPDPPVPLKYGELREILHAAKKNPSISFQNVRVTPGAIAGELHLTDRISDGTANQIATRKIDFRAPRLGVENDPDLYSLLHQAVGAGYQGEEEPSPWEGFYSLFVVGLFLILMGVGLLLILRWVSGGSSPFSFGRSKAKMYLQNDVAVTFDDVAGIDEAVEELREVVDFLRSSDKYQALGGRIPKGILLVGPPGTGKTLLARAVAGEAHVPFFSMSGSDFVEMFVGVGAARVRDLFTNAAAKAPCIIFIDELDALGKSRAGNVVGSHDEREQTLNQLLVEMDGFDANQGVIIVGATNRPETLDQALLRPGRFDRTVVVDQPDVVGREAILKVHVRDVKLGNDVDLSHVARLTPGSVGADLENLVNEAALLAARNGKESVDMAEFNEAVERLAVGPERKSRIMRAEEKLRVAYHEAGHALVSCDLPSTDPVHKISIIPRGVGVGGYVLSRPDNERRLLTRGELESQIRICLGGTLAEEIIFDEISTGASSDLQKANMIARRMVTEFGMSKLGRTYFAEGNGSPYLNGLFADTDRDHSEETAREIDLEVRRLIHEATEEVRGLLTRRQDALDAIAKLLVEQEVIEGKDLTELLEEFRIIQEEDASSETTNHTT